MTAVSAQRTCLHQLFTAQARRTPDRIAVTDGRRELTYRQLDEAAEGTARRLRALGVGPEVLVGVCVERDVDLVVAVLAVLKAGGGYVPLDPRYPPARLAYILDDCRCDLVVGHRRFADVLGPTRARFVDLADRAPGTTTGPDPVDGGAQPDNVAYVIHTSGSTGRPKGVVVSHANVTRLFAVTREAFGFGVDDTWTLFHSYAFDFSVWEMWGALLHGGTLVVVSYPVSRDPEAFWRLVVDERVTMLSQTPSAFRQLVRAAEADGWPATALRGVVFGGEALAPGMLRPWFDHYGDTAPRLVNMYGITETTVHVTLRPLSRADAAGTGSPVGVPLTDLTATVLDADLRPVTVDGQPGELYVGGAGITRGYLHRPGLTASRFVPDPAGPPGARRYRTGDVATWRDGELDYLGRMDDQIQFRGFRVEPGEIEAALASLPGVSAAAVVARADGDGGEHLAGFVVGTGRANDPATDPRALRAALAERLPGHLVPTTIDVLAALPLTASGKLDRGALRGMPVTSASPAPASGSAPADASTAPAAQRLAAIWADVLGVAEVGLKDNFFALGGDSMTAIRAVSLARDAGVMISVADLFRHTTIAALLDDGATGTSDEASIVWDSPDPGDGVVDTYPASLLQVGVIYECQLSGDPTLYHDVTTVRVSGPLDPAALRRALDALATRHELLRAAFDLFGHAEPVQVVYRSAPIPLTVLDAPATAGPQQAVRRWWAGQQYQPFDPTVPPLARCHVLRHPDGTFDLALSVHHAVVDGWSFSVLMADLLRAYDHELGGGAPLGPPPPVRHRDFVALERRAVADPDTTAHWAAHLDGYRPPPWAGDPRPESTVSTPLDAALVARVRQFAVRSGVPPKSVYLAAHLWALGRLTDVPDVLAGLATNGRPERDGADDAVGMFVNTVPVRVRIPDGSWRELVDAVFAAERAGLPYRRLPLGQLRARTGLRPPDTLFTFADFRPFDALRLLRKVRPHEWWFGDRNEFPLSLTVVRRPMSPEWDLVVTTGPAGGGTELAERMSRYTLHALDRMVTDPDERCGPAPG